MSSPCVPPILWSGESSADLKQCRYHGNCVACRHLGDLGNIREINGEVRLQMQDNKVSIIGRGKNNVLGRTMVVSTPHTQATDCIKTSLYRVVHSAKAVCYIFPFL